MLLAIDLGNTNLTCGIYSDDRLEQTFRAQTVHARTLDEYAALLVHMAALHGVTRTQIDGAILASVVPPLTEVLLGAVSMGFGVRPMLVGPGIKTGVSVLYDNPHDVGSDRIVNAVAAYHRAQGPAIVVDMGTATTFDCISPKGEYLGGVIVPGVEISLNALMSRAAKLRPIEIAEPPTVIGRNTHHALQSGVVFGYASLIDGMVAKIQAELGHPCSVIGTGGLAELLSKHATSIQSVDPNLTLDGLRILYARNKQRRS